jgi:hypothetical protein
VAQLVIRAHEASSLRFGSTSVCTPTHPSRSTELVCGEQAVVHDLPAALHDDAELRSMGSNERKVLEPCSKGVRKAIWTVGGDHS